MAAAAFAVEREADPQPDRVGLAADEAVIGVTAGRGLTHSTMSA